MSILVLCTIADGFETQIDVVQEPDQMTIRSKEPVKNSITLLHQHAPACGATPWPQASNLAVLGDDAAVIAAPQAGAESVTKMDGAEGSPVAGIDNQERLTPRLSIIAHGTSEHMALSSEAIVQWMRECTPTASEQCAATSTDSNSTTTSSIHASPSLLSLAGSYKSQGTWERAQMLLDKSINAIASLKHAMDMAEFVMLVQLAGASGVCRSVVKILANLASKCALATGITCYIMSNVLQPLCWCLSLSAEICRCLLTVGKCSLVCSATLFFTAHAQVQLHPMSLCNSVLSMNLK